MLYNSSAEEEDETETLSAGSRDDHRADDFLPDEEVEVDEADESEQKKPKRGLGLNFLRTLSFDPAATASTSKEKLEDAEAQAKRKIPPALSDWNRSQSFPPPTGKSFGGSGENSDKRPIAEAGTGTSVFGGRPLTKGVSSVASSVVSCNSDIEGIEQNHFLSFPWVTGILLISNLCLVPIMGRTLVAN